MKSLKSSVYFALTAHLNLGLATFQLLNSHRGLMAPEGEKPALGESHVNSISPPVQQSPASPTRSRLMFSCPLPPRPALFCISHFPPWLEHFHQHINVLFFLPCKEQTNQPSLGPTSPAGYHPLSLVLFAKKKKSLKELSALTISSSLFSDSLLNPLESDFWPHFAKGLLCKLSAVRPPLWWMSHGVQAPPGSSSSSTLSPPSPLLVLLFFPQYPKLSPLSLFFCHFLGCSPSIRRFPG